MRRIEEDGSLFQTATSTMSVIIQTKQNGAEITDELVDKMLLRLRMKERHFSLSEQQTSGAAIIISARIALPKLTTRERITLIPIFNQGLNMVSNFDKLPCFLWKNVEPLFHAYLESIPDDAPGAKNVFNFILKIFNVLRDSSSLNEDFYAYHSILSPATLIQSTVNVITNENRDVEVRKVALEVLSRVVSQCPPSKAPTISLLVSGLLSGLMKTMTSPSLNVELKEKSALLFTDAVILVFGDNAQKFDISQLDLKQFHPSLHSVFLNQTDEWRTNGVSTIQEYMVYIAERHLNSRVFNVKKAVCLMLYRIQENCGKLFGDKLDAFLMSLYFHLRYDDYTYFQELAQESLLLVKDSNKVRTFFSDQLKAYSTKIPIFARQGKGDSAIKALCAILGALGEGITLMCTTGSETIDLLLRCLADSIIVDKKRLMITNDVAAETIEQFLKKFQLMYGVRHDSVKLICGMLVALGRLEVVNMVHNLMKVETSRKRASYHILLAYMLSSFNLDATPSDDPIVLMIAEYLTEETNKACVIQLKDDSRPFTHGFELDMGTCIESLSLINVTLCMKFIGGVANRSNISINCLCTILSQTNSPDWIVAESADFSLKILTNQEKKAKDVHRLVKIYSSHILNRVSLACASSTDYHMAPILLKSYLRYSGIANHFDTFRVIVEKMLYALDNNQQKYTYALLQTILSFMAALNTKYPYPQPLAPVDDEEDGKCRPTPELILIEKILLRCKHMLTSEHLPIRLTALEILSEGIDFLKCYDDMLLPMIHQNWYGVMTIVKDQEPLTLTSVIDRIEEMTEKSGSFVHNKVLKEFWPAVEKYFMNILRAKKHNKHSAEYGLICKFITRAPQIIMNLKLTEQEANDSFMKVVNFSIEMNGTFATLGQTQKNTINAYFKNLN